MQSWSANTVFKAFIFFNFESHNLSYLNIIFQVKIIYSILL